MDTSLLDRAVKYEIKKHSGVPRRKTLTPYSTHVMEACAICATITDDQEILAAAVLHDVIEDTDATYEDLLNLFGKRVADFVLFESDSFEEDGHELTWKERKIKGLEKIKAGSYEEQICAIGDKLSNMRAIARDYKVLGDKFFERFYISDPLIHKWRYEALVDAFDKIHDTFAFQEFKYLVDSIFGLMVPKNEIIFDKGYYYLLGTIDENMFFEIEKNLEKGVLYKFDLLKTKQISFKLIRHLIDMSKTGYRFQFVNCNDGIFSMLVQAGLINYYSVLKKPIDFSVEGLEQYGEGYTSVVYSDKNHDMIAKVYRPFIPLIALENEKLASDGLNAMGFETPLSGELIKVGSSYGLIFEQVTGKKSIARAIADDIENLEFYMKKFAEMCFNLHHTTCLKSYFGDCTLKYYHALEKYDYDRETKNKIISLLESTPKMDVCSHGDMHIGNLITVDDKYMFIDLADFGYGNPLFDLGTLYFITHYCEDDKFFDMFHFDAKYKEKVWNSFIKEYFKDLKEEEIKEKEKEIKRYSGFTMLFFFSRGEMTKEKKKAILDTLLG